MIINPQTIIQKEILTNIPSVVDQIQQNGIDITVKSISQLDFSDSNTLTKEKRSHCRRIELDLSQPILLDAGIYDIGFTEIISIPNGMMAQIFTRSTVNRGGNFVTAGLYDAGYKGVLGAILHVNIPLTIESGVRLAQIVFSQAEEGSTYEGIYNTQTIA